MFAEWGGIRWSVVGVDAEDATPNVVVGRAGRLPDTVCTDRLLLEG
jgi:hypothetical protein